MAQFKDIAPTTFGWIHELAKGEIHPEADRLLQLGKSFDPNQLIEESTIEFLSELREHFSEYSKIFNGYSDSGTRFQDIKIYSVAQTVADFMVYRNQVKLLVSSSAMGLIHIGYAKHSTGRMSLNGQSGTEEQGRAEMSQPQELMAQVGPFRNVYWSFQGEKVSPEQVAKFYFSEFIRATRSTQKSKLGNQFLLEEIKSLLKEKGIDF